MAQGEAEEPTEGLLSGGRLRVRTGPRGREVGLGSDRHDGHGRVVVL